MLDPPDHNETLPAAFLKLNKSKLNASHLRVRKRTFSTNTAESTSFKNAILQKASVDGGSIYWQNDNKPNNEQYAFLEPHEDTTLGEICLDRTQSIIKLRNKGVHVVEQMVPGLDRGWAWFVLLGAFFTHVFIDGCGYSFGVLLPYLVDEFKSSKATTSLINSIMYCFALCSGPVISVLIKRLGIHNTNLIGAILSFIGAFTSVFTRNVMEMTITFGVIFGLGSGFSIISSVVAVSMYFHEKRSLAYGIMFSGTGIGMLLIAPMLATIIDFGGWQAAFLTFACFSFSCTVLSSFYRPLELISEVDATLKNLATQEEHQFMCYRRVKHPLVTNAEDPNNKVKRNAFTKFWFEVYQELDLDVFKNTNFVLFSLSTFLLTVGSTGIYVFLTSLALKDPSVSRPQAASLISIMGGGNTVGRVFFGFIADRLNNYRIHMYIGLILLTSALTFASTLSNNYIFLTIFSVLFGISAGGQMLMTPILCSDIVTFERMASAFGMIMMFIGLGCVAGPPLGGVVCDATNSFETAFQVYAAISLVSGLVMVPIVFSKKLPANSKTNLTQSVVSAESQICDMPDEEEMGLKPRNRLKSNALSVRSDNEHDLPVLKKFSNFDPIRE